MNYNFMCKEKSNQNSYVDIYDKNANSFKRN